MFIVLVKYFKAECHQVQEVKATSGRKRIELVRNVMANITDI